MKLASITLPLLDNRGDSLAFVHDWLELTLVDEFGGYSKVPVQGAWRDDKTGKLYRDSSFRYEFATDAGAWQTIKYLASEAAFLAKQECVFVIDTKGEVHFIQPHDHSVMVPA